MQVVVFLDGLRLDIKTYLSKQFPGLKSRTRDSDVAQYITAKKKKNLSDWIITKCPQILHNIIIICSVGLS